MVVIIVGGQWGDEGKGKVIDLLAKRAEVVVRAQGGDNAGHTVVNEQVGSFALHLVPAGIFNPRTTCIIGDGVALNPVFLLEELEALRALREEVGTGGGLPVEQVRALLAAMRQAGAQEAEVQAAGLRLRLRR